MIKEYFSQAYSFWRMLMKHKNFNFTQFPDKTNNMIFLKSPKTCCWTILVIFAQWGFFPKNPAVIHYYIWALNTMPSFRKKLMSHFWENCRKDKAGASKRKGARIWFFSRLLPANVIDFFWKQFLLFSTAWKIGNTGGFLGGAI